MTPVRPDQSQAAASWEVHHAIDAAPQSNHAPCVYVVREKLSRVTRLGSLLGREQPLLAERCLEQAVLVRVLRLGGTHAQDLSVALVSCTKRAATSAESWPKGATFQMNSLRLR